MHTIASHCIVLRALTTIPRWRVATPSPLGDPAVSKPRTPASDRAKESLMSPMYPNRRSALSLAVAIALGIPVVGYAADAPASDQELEEVVVTGIRASIQTSIQVKADLQSISEVVSAEDIGKLPDTSIADSIARLPGVTTQRAEGRASLISIRGTDPGFSVGLMNGREQVSTGDNRAIEYDQYPSELINQVVVFKTPDSQLVAQGLSGTIDLRTIRPLDYGKQAVVLNLRGERNSQSGDMGANAPEKGYRASISYIDQFMDGKLGVAVGFARLISPIATQAFGTYEPWEPAKGNQWDPRLNPGIPPDAYITKGMKVRSDMGTNERDGYLATVEYRPNDNWGSILDLYYTDATQVDNARSLEVNLGGYPGPCCDGPFPSDWIFGYSNATIKRDTVVAGNLNNVVPLARNFRFTTDDKIFAGGWLNEFRVTDQWQVRADLSYSGAKRDQYQPETNAQYVPQTANPNLPRNIYDNGYVNFRDGKMGQMTFGLDYASPFVQVGPTIYGAGYAKKPHVEDTLWAGSLVGIREGEAWWFSNMSFGLNYSDRSKDKKSPEAGLSTINNDYYWISAAQRLRPTDLSYAKAGDALAWNVNQVLRAYYNPIVWGNPETLTYLAGKWWTVDEKVWTGFGRAELDHVLSDSVTLKGNAGLQVIYSDQSSDSFAIVNGKPAPISGGKSYTDVLPQVNLVFELPDRQAVRFAVSQQMARARMDQLKASTEYGFDNSTGKPGGSGGNPELDPWRAWAVDLSYDKYLSDFQGYFSGAFFYKDLTSYIYNTTDSNYDFCNAGLPPPSNLPVPPLCIGSFTTPKNGQGGNLYGFEASFALPFSAFADMLDGFGFEASYAYTKSSIEIETINPPGVLGGGFGLGKIPLPGLSENVANGTLYYEKHGFAARFAARYRSKFIGEVTNFANDRALRYVDGGTLMDAQVSYAFSEGSMNGLTLLFQVNNLTNEPYYAYNEDTVRYQDYQKYGTVYLLGATYKVGGQ
ncbi:MAG: TonB-dependent receptor [Gammaproteobacteria bacterium]|nr:TonB-dependent receptor [Gammaproteobacteria bacterium]